jgi:hypothetical protein
MTGAAMEEPVKRWKAGRESASMPIKPLGAVIGSRAPADSHIRSRQLGTDDAGLGAEGRRARPEEMTDPAHRGDAGAQRENRLQFR